MNNIPQPTTDGLKPITTDLAKANISLSLTKANLNFQNLSDEIARIPKNEDGIQEMANLIAKAKEIENKINEAHQIGKKPYLDGGKSWDTAKNDLLNVLAGSTLALKAKYAQLCKEVEKRRIEAENKAKQDKAILDGIETNLMTFSSQITACKTNKELVGVEARINLEKSRTTKYGEFMPILLEKLVQLTELVKTQKATVQELEKIQKEKIEAEQSGDDGKLLELMDREEIVTQKVHENKINIETKVVNNSSVYSEGYTVAKEVFPQIKGRKQWKMRLDDPKKALAAGLLNVEINTIKAKAVMADLKKDNPDSQEFFKDGICYYESTNY
jgi:hypothetical protein